MKTRDILQKILVVVFFACMITLTDSCKKDPEAPTGGNKILIGTTTLDTISYLSAKVSTQLNSTGGNQITQHGHCWSGESGPDIEDAHTSLGSIAGPEKVISSLSGLSDNKKYFIRPYFTYQVGTIYGIQKEITTLKRGKPVVTTGVPSVITISSVKISGAAIFDSGCAITQKGICWDTAANPSLQKSIGHSQAGADTGTFISSIYGLIDNRQYYFCAYATNEKGTTYGLTKQFITVEITKPVVSTLDASAITISSATCGGFVSNDGKGTVTGRGVCWNILGNPTLSNCISKSSDGSGIGNYSSQVTGLTDGTTYYVAAYATNEKGTSYGEIKSFTTLSLSKPTVLTADITTITSTTAVCGGTVISEGNGTVTARGVCWSINSAPTTTSAHTVDGSGMGNFNSNLTGLIPNTLYYIRSYATNLAGTSYGSEKPFTTLTTPTVTTTAITNLSQTTATGGGNVTSDGGATVTARGVCWNTSSNPTIANSHTSDGTGTGGFVSTLPGLTANTLYYVRAYATNIYGTNYGNGLPFTTLNPFLPTVNTLEATNITQTTATSGGDVISDGGATVTARGVCWSISPNPTIAGSHTTNGSGTNTFVSNLTGLTPNTPYFILAYATNSVGTAYGKELTFTTQAPFVCGNSLTINHVTGTVAPVNKTVTYGTVTNIPGETSKCWITSNLGADHQATTVNDATEQSAGWYWQFNRKQGYKYDGTTRTPNTTWITSINQNSDWIIANDPCAIEFGDGWRIPTKSEWENIDATGNWTNWNGPWNSGLKLHAAGYLDHYDGSLIDRGLNGNYWSSTQDNATYGWYPAFSSGTSTMQSNNKAYGLSTRCVRDF